MLDNEETTEGAEEEVETPDTSEESENEEGAGEETTPTDASKEFEQYIDLKNVPPQFREAAKRMLASYTKAHQALRGTLDSERKAFESKLSTEFAQAVRKARAFDEVINNPAFQQWWADIESNRPYGYSSVFNRGTGSKEESTAKETSLADDEGSISMEKLIAQLTPVIEKVVQQRTAPLIDQHAKLTWKQAEKEFPNIHKYKAEITELLQEFPNMGLERAYKIASEEERVKEAVASAMKDAQITTDKLKGKRTEKGNVGGGTTLTPKTVKTLKDAIVFARDQMASGG